MDVAEFLKPFGFGMNVEVVISHKPEWPLIRSLGDGCLQCQDCAVEHCSLGFGNQQMHMFGHHHVAENVKDVASAYRFEGGLEQVTGSRAGKIRKPTVTTEGEEMKSSLLLEPFKSGRHSEGILLPP